MTSGARLDPANRRLRRGVRTLDARVRGAYGDLPPKPGAKLFVLVVIVVGLAVGAWVLLAAFADE